VANREASREASGASRAKLFILQNDD